MDCYYDHSIALCFLHGLKVLVAISMMFIHIFVSIYLLCSVKKSSEHMLVHVYNLPNKNKAPLYYKVNCFYNIFVWFIRRTFTVSDLMKGAVESFISLNPPLDSM